MSKSTNEDVFEFFKTDSSLHFEHFTIYFPIALIVTSLPLYLYYSIFAMDFFNVINLSLFGVVTFFSALILTFAYHNIAYSLKTRLEAQTQADFVDMANMRNSSKKENLQTKRNERSKAATNETLLFSILYNNALFLSVVVLLSFFVFQSASAPFNYVLSVSLSATVLSFFASASN